MKSILIMSMALIMAADTMAQEKRLFTIDDLVSGGSTYYDCQPERMYTEWWGDELVKLGVDECSVIDKVTGNATQLVSLSEVNAILRSYGKRQLSHLLRVKFPYPGKSLLMAEMPDEQVIVDWKEANIHSSIKFGNKAENKDWEPTSNQIAYTDGYNLCVAKADGKTYDISQDGTIDLVYGQSVHRNEFGIEKGTFWSPSGKYLAFYRMDQSMVTTYPQVDISPRVAELAPDKYPMAGMNSHKVTVGIYNAETQKIVYLNAGDPTNRYFTNIAWSPDEKSVYMIELNRDQNHAQLIQYNAMNGQKEKVLFEEKNDKYVEPMHPIRFLPWDSEKFVYLTRKDGFLHIYLYNTEGKELAQLTKGEFEVIDFLGFDKKHKTILYTSNEANLIQNNLYKVDMKGHRTLLGNATGWHRPTISSSGSFVCDEYSSPEIARNIDLIETGKGKQLNLLTASDPWDAFQVPEMKVGTIKAADGVTDLYYRLTLPTNFDPNKKYPAVVYVYGGPHAHNVDASLHWGIRGWDVFMAQQGYIMFSLDNRGSEHRGLAFEQATFRHLGDVEMADQMKGVEFLKSLPYVDADRLGVDGWSFGGFMTINLITSFPETFKVGVAGGPVVDWKYYEVMYGERYMDTPQTNPEGYASSSLLPKAKNLKGRLLVIYGGNDPTCVPQHTLSFIRACIDAGTYPDLFTYPGDEHNMRGTDRVHLENKITRYFNDFLRPLNQGNNNK